jgi:profilin-like protein
MVTISEPAVLRQAIETGTTEHGLFITGEKYRLVQYDAELDGAGSQYGNIIFENFFWSAVFRH